MRRTLAILLSAALAAGQNAPEPDITFRTTTQLVIVNVTVRDKSGKLVEGLQASDFTLSEDGNPQKIVAFEYQKVDALPVSRDFRASTAERVAPRAPGAITSLGRGEVRYKDRRLLVMFFDQASLAPAELWRARDAALKFVREDLTASDLVAVFTYSKELQVLQDFTDDRDQLTSVIRKLAVETDNRSFQNNDEFNIFNTDVKLAALTHALRILGSLAERKALVYFSGAAGGGTGTENESQLRSTINAAQRSNVVFYPVDAGGLQASAPMGNAISASPGGLGLYSGEAVRQAAAHFGGDETLYRLANETGGKALVDNNNLSMGLRQAQTDLSSYYILAYYSSNTEQDGKYRRIKVQTASNTNARLEYRQGYYAPKLFRHFSAADRERQLQEALVLGNPITDLPIAVEADHFQLDRRRYLAVLAVKIPGDGIQAASPRPGSGTAHLDLILQVKGDNGSVAAAVRDKIELRLDGEAAAQLTNRSLQYDTSVTLAPGKYQVKVVARENTAGRIGTFESILLVPDLATEQRYLPISSVVLGNDRVGITSDPSRKIERGKASHHPLFQDGQKLIPSVTRVFRRDQQIHLYLEAYHAAGTVPVSVRVGFYRGTTKSFESEPLHVMQASKQAPTTIPVNFSVPLAALAPGRYTCQVSVLAPTIQKFAFWRAPIILLP